MTDFYSIPKAVTIQAGIKMARSYRNVQLRTITFTRKVLIIKNVGKFEFTAIFTTVRYKLWLRDKRIQSAPFYTVFYYQF